MTDFLVSIVMPSYNSGLHIKKAIDSVIAQTYVKWELIIIDNFSSDQTIDIVSSYSNDKIKIFKIHNEGIIAKSRNLGIQESSGSLIAFLDSDDWWAVNKLSESVKYIQSGYDIVYHALKIVNNSNRIIFQKTTYTKNFENNLYSKLIEHGNFISNSSVVVKKYYLEAISYISEDVDLIAAEDYDCWLKISKLTNRFYCINKSLGYYFYNGTGANTLEKQICNLEYLKNKYINKYIDATGTPMPVWVMYFDLKFSYDKKNYKKSQILIKALIKRDLTNIIKLKIFFILVKSKFNYFLT